MEGPCSRQRWSRRRDDVLVGSRYAITDWPRPTRELTIALANYKTIELQLLERVDELADAVEEVPPAAVGLVRRAARVRPVDLIK